MTEVPQASPASGAPERPSPPDDEAEGSASSASSAPHAAAPEGSDVGAWVTYAMYRAMGLAMQKLPEVVATTAASVVGRTLSHLAGPSKAMYERHVRRVLGPEVSEEAVRKTTREAYLNYARYWLEGARLPAVSAEVVESRFVVESGWEHLVEGSAAGRGVILALPHVGSWEWGAVWLALKGYPVTSVAEPLRPPAMYEWFVSQREAMGMTIFPLGNEASGALLRTLRAGKLVCLLCDRDIGGGGVEVEFFGERTTMPGGPALLALRTGAALLPTAVYTGPGIGHSAVIMAPVPAERTGALRKDVARVTQLVAHDLERLIRRAPEQWHLFQPNWPSDTAI